jgi:S-adenosylmethionine:tRNA ribosyltransferase-isomerase
MLDPAVYAIGALGRILTTMSLQDFHFDLPPELIAQRPAASRSASRLLTLDGSDGAFRDRQFRDLPLLLNPADLLVFNDTRVIPARAFGSKESGGRVEILLERALGDNVALAHVRASKGLREGARVQLAGGHSVRMLGRDEELFRLEFSCPVAAFFEAHGEIPLPPYIDRAPEEGDRERYQTVYSHNPGAVAAPTAGLHFDADVLQVLQEKGVRHCFVTLHVGSGTFAPIRDMQIDKHRMHAEYLEVSQSACDAILATRAAGGRVVAVGTTVVRSLETAAQQVSAGGALIEPYRGMTRIFIRPGHRFRAVDALLTNFHLPQSTLLMLCSAFVGREALLAAYAHAVQARYRFFSYGDAMFLTPSPHAI